MVRHKLGHGISQPRRIQALELGLGQCGVAAVASMVPSDQRQVHKIVEILLGGGGSAIIKSGLSVSFGIRASMWLLASRS